MTWLWLEFVRWMRRATRRRAQAAKRLRELEAENAQLRAEVRQVTSLWLSAPSPF